MYYEATAPEVYDVDLSEEQLRSIKNLEEMDEPVSDAILTNVRDAVMSNCEVKEENNMATEITEKDIKAMEELIEKVGFNMEKNKKELEKMYEKSEDNEGFFASILSHWKWIGGTAAVMIGVYFIYKYVFGSNNGSEGAELVSNLALYSLLED